jgi:AraC-like DNA-binding protein
MQEISISSYFLRAVLKQASAQGADAQELLGRANIPPRLLAQSGARVTAEQFASLQAITMRQMRDELLGYCGQPQKPGTWAVLSHWLIHAQDLGQMLKRFCHFYGVIERGFKAKLTLRDNHLIISFRPWGEKTFEPYAYELFLFCLHRFACWLMEDSLPIRQVTLPYPQPEQIDEYRALFPRAECLFEKSDCRMVFDRDLLDKPVKQTPETLSHFLQQPLLNILINDYNLQSWAAKTRAVLRDSLADLQSLDEVAGQFGIHPKTLRRSLRAEGIGYSELKSQLRRDIAIRHLTRTTDSIEKIASLVGFSESSTFIRAFKMWTGVTPSSYRKLGEGKALGGGK